MPRSTIKQLESELLKALKWNILRTTSFDFAQILKMNGFLFSDDTINGQFICTNKDTLIKKAHILLDTLIEQICLNCEYSEFFPSEIASACILCVRISLGLDNPYSESLRELLCCHGKEIIEISNLILGSFEWVLESSAEVPTDLDD